MSMNISSSYNWKTSQYKQWFDKLRDEVPDSNTGNGGITFNDLYQRIIQNSGKTPIAMFLATNFGNVDSNNNGILENREIKGANRENGQPLFNLTVDQTITTTQSKFDNWFQRLENESPYDDYNYGGISQQDLQDRMARGDTEGFQTSRASFLQQNFDRLNTNYDGVLSMQEVYTAQFADGANMFSIVPEYEIPSSKIIEDDSEMTS